MTLLGEQALIDDQAGSVQVRSSRAVALIAFLAVHAGSPQSRQRIAGLLWPDSADAQALTNLRRELHHLRQVLGSEASLVVTPRELCWRDTGTCVVDVRVFDRERQAALAAAAAGDDEGTLTHGAVAVDAYRGDLLPGVYEDWLLEARSQLERRCVELCDLLAATRSRTGDLAGAVQTARRRVQLEPLEEVGYRALMELQADLGDRAGAISTYHHCASVLERELGVSPDLATRTAFQRLMAQGEPAAPARAPRPGVAAAALVGRAAELGALHGAWRAAATGSRGVVLVRGEPGAGKTRLVTEVAEIARQQGAVVATARCFGAAGRLALAPVADWLRHEAVRSAAETLDPVWRAEVARLLPAAGSGAGARAMTDAWQRHRFFEGLTRALTAVSSPLLLVLDNMQWCDQETLAFVTFCLGLADDARLLVAATVREDDLGENRELAAWTMRMRATGLLTEIPLGPLPAADVARLAEAMSGQRLPAADTSLLQAATGGFPLYVIEAVRGRAASDAALPAGDLTAVLRKRLDQGTPAARQLAGLAAAAGANFTLDLLTEASDLDTDAVVAALDELWRRRIVRELRDGYDFSHDLLRETAYAQISPPQRWLLHRRIAQALELLHPDTTDAVAVQLAEQYARGGRPERALAYYHRAADVAAGRFAYTEEIRLHEQALSVIAAMPAGRDRDARELGVLEVMAAPLNARHGYASSQVQQALERSVTLAESLGRADSRVAALASLGGALFVQGCSADSYRTASHALELAASESKLAGQAHLIAGFSAFSLARPAEALEHAELAAELAAGAVWLSFGTRPDVHGKTLSAHALWLLGREDEALARCQEAIALARAIDHPYSLVLALSYACVTHQMRRDLPGLRNAVEELRRLCDQYGFAYYQEWALIADGWSRADASGLDLVWHGVANLRAQGAFARMPYWLTLLADLYARAGRPQDARATLDAALATGHAHRDLWWLPEVMRMRAAYDDEQAAVSRLRLAVQRAADSGSVALLRRCQRDLSARSASAPGVSPAVRGVRPVA